MSLEPIAVIGCVIEHGSGSVITGGTFVITSTPSTKVKPGGLGAYKGTTIAFTFSGGSGGGCTDGTVTGSGTISASALKVKAENQLVIREGDIGTMNWTGTNPSPPPTNLTGTSNVVISSAGQTKVKAA